MQRKSLALFAVVLMTITSSLHAQTLKGSRDSMQRQYQLAVRYGYSFLQNSQSVTKFVNDGYLVKVTGDRMTELHDVSYPYARPEVKMFIQRLSGQYFSSCGEKLTVTSLTRPLNKQPANAADDSVHPTGMAVDLRIPSVRKCRTWLENTLLSLEGTGVLDVTRERNPPHYHVAVYTKTYETYVANLGTETNEYLVMRGDTLSSIATRTGTSIMALRSSNALANDLIRVGQKLQIPREASMEPMSGTTSASALILAAETPLVGPPAPDNLDKTIVNAVATTAPVSTSTFNTTMAEDTPVPVQIAVPVEYKVRRGDSLTSIASRMGTTIEDLRRVNGLRNSTIIAGQTLLIPTLPQVLAQGSAPAQPADQILAVEHKVKRGESLWRIANRYGTSISSLRMVNSLADDNLKPGQVLQVRLGLH